MSTLFILLFLASGGAFLTGLAKPGIVKMNSRKTSSLVYGGGAIAFAIAAGATIPEKTAQQTEQTKQTEQAKQTEQTEQQASNKKQPTNYSKGETIEHKGWTLMINRVNYTERIGGQTGENAKGKYAIIFATVENNTKETASIPGSFKVMDNQDRTFKGLGAEIYADQYEVAPIWDQFPPGAPTEAMIAFDVAPDVESPTLVWSTGMLSNKEYRINLQ